MKWFTSKSLSDDDMTYLTGTELMTNLQRNRLVIVYDYDEAAASASDLGLLDKDIKGMFHYRILGRASKTGKSQQIEILFEKDIDLFHVQEKLTLIKLADN